MKLTVKDKEFLEKLNPLIEEKGLWIDLKSAGMKSIILRKNYGDKIESEFGMTRQGIRWRFQKITDMYVSALETIYYIENHLGAHLRQKALEVSKERILMRKKNLEQTIRNNARKT